MRHSRSRNLRARSQRKPLRHRLYKLSSLVCSQAQRTQVYRQKEFLTQSEIADVHAAIMQLNLQPYTNNPLQDIDKWGNAVHTTSYISSSDIFDEKLLWLKSRVFDLVHTTNSKNGWGFDSMSDKFNVRVAEYHEMEVNGSLDDPHHYDVGSLITVDIMLKGAAHDKRPSQFVICISGADSGAEFKTLEQNGELLAHTFRPGDALVFVSHKKHTISKLCKGSRRVLIFEFWNGVERHCGHRCDKPRGDCSFLVTDS